jgi:hypothetical protein
MLQLIPAAEVQSGIYAAAAAAVPGMLPAAAAIAAAVGSIPVGKRCI